jgi:hypothetical protein
MEAQNLLGCTAALMMEAASVDIQLRTRQYIQKILSFILAAMRT